MRRSAVTSMLAVAALAGFAGLGRAAEPPHVTFVPKAPGTVTQSRLVYLSGEGMQSQWRGVASKKYLGASGGTKFYQWYLSIYAIDGSTYHLKYRSPGSGGPLDVVEEAPGSSMWFPMQDLSIVGAAELMEPSVQQLVVHSHQTGADCGTAHISVLGYDNASGKVVPEVVVDNGCELQAKIVHGTHGDTLSLTGPYYGPKSALCCPTKPKATATLAYRNGKWVETPRYFDLYVKRFPAF